MGRTCSEAFIKLGADRICASFSFSSLISRSCCSDCYSKCIISLGDLLQRVAKSGVWKFALGLVEHRSFGERRKEDQAS